MNPEDRLRRLLGGMAWDQPPAEDRWGALVARRRRRQAWQAGTIGSAGVAVVVVAALTLSGGGTTQSLVSTDPTDTPTPTAQASETAEPTPAPTVSVATKPTPTDVTPTATTTPTVVTAVPPVGTPPAPLRIGAVGAWSYPAPNSLLSTSRRAAVPELLRAWAARYDRTALRKVQLTVEDSKGSPSTLHQQVQDLVASGVDGFVATDVDSWTESYLRARGIPVLGGDLGSSLWSSSPVLFAPGTDSAALWDGLAVLAARSTPHGYLGVLCPSQSCAGPARLINDRRAAKYGLDPTYLEELAASSTDYTGTVIRLRQSGVTVVALAGLAPQQATGIAKAAADQSYAPHWVLSSDLAESSPVLDEPLLRGALSPQQVLPWPAAPAAFAEDLPSGVERNAALTGAWASTQLLAAAIVFMHDAPAAPADLRAAADRLDGQTAGGVLAPLRPHAVQRCFFVAQVGAGAWKAPDGLATACGKP